MYSVISGGNVSNVDTKTRGTILNLRRSPGVDEPKKTKKIPIWNNQSLDPDMNPQNGKGNGKGKAVPPQALKA
jgi:hypothetical protein